MVETKPSVPSEATTVNQVKQIMFDQPLGFLVGFAVCLFFVHKALKSLGFFEIMSLTEKIEKLDKLIEELEEELRN